MGNRGGVLRSLLIATLVLGPLATAWAQPSDVVYVSRERLLREVQAAQVLAKAEQEFTAELQQQVDTFREALSKEEAEIAKLRAELTPEDLNLRVADFDRRMRMGRRLSQERAAELQAGFQQSRARIVAALPRILEMLRTEAGARIVLNTEQILAADPALDMTRRAIELYDTEGPPPVMPEVNLSLPPLGVPDIGSGERSTDEPVSDEPTEDKQ